MQAVYEQREQIRSLHERVRGGGGAQAGSVGLDAVAWAEQVVWSRAFASTVMKAGERGSPPPPPPPPPPPDVKTKVLFEAEWLGKLKEMLPGDVGETLRLGRDPSLASGPMEMALMPMLDALNHASTASVSCSFDAEADAFVLSSDAPLAQGEQAVLSYGEKGNDELLQLFGFVEEANPHDAFLCIGLEEQAR